MLVQWTYHFIPLMRSLTVSLLYTGSHLRKIKSNEKRKCRQSQMCSKLFPLSTQNTHRTCATVHTEFISTVRKIRCNIISILSTIFDLHNFILLWKVDLFMCTRACVSVCTHTHGCVRFLHADWSKAYTINLIDQNHLHVEHIIYFIVRHTT